eukprot:9330638-Pyramimonas_sp.AAC.1
MGPSKPAAGGVNVLLSASYCACLSCRLPCRALTLRLCFAAVFALGIERGRAGLHARAEGSFPCRRRVVGWPAPSLRIFECSCFA